MAFQMALFVVFENLILDDLNSDVYNSLPQCAHLCYHDQACESFLYNNETRHCINSHYMISHDVFQSDLEPAQGYKYYEWRKESCDGDKGWRFDRRSGACFRLITHPETLSDAITTCDNYTSTLMTVDTPCKFNLLSKVATFTDSNLWSGGENVNGTWFWTSGLAVDQSSWSTDCDANNQSCLLMDADGLCTTDCDDTQSFVCVKNEALLTCLD